jgi:hypothetical protein
MDALKKKEDHPDGHMPKQSFCTHDNACPKQLWLNGAVCS